MSPQVTKWGTGVEERSDETDEGAPVDGANGYSPLIRHFVPPSPQGVKALTKRIASASKGGRQSLPRPPSQSRIRSTALPRGELFCGAAKLLVLPRALSLGELSPQVTERARVLPSTMPLAVSTKTSPLGRGGTAQAVTERVPLGFLLPSRWWSLSCRCPERQWRSFSSCCSHRPRPPQGWCAAGSPAAPPRCVPQKSRRCGCRSGSPG